MNLSQRAYLAGIVDGEGTITLTRHHANESFSPEISIANTNLELLKWIQSTTECGIIIRKKRKLQHHSQAYTWRVRGNKAINILKQLSSLLLVKRKHSNLIISNYKKLTPRNGKYTPELLLRKNELVAQIKELNSR